MPALLLFLGTVSLVCLSNAAPLDPCVRLSCLNNGTCGSLLHRLASYNCSCPPGLAGLRCQDRVDNCASNPCHRGNCSSSDDGYVCVCEEGYQGDTCDQPLPSTLTPTWAESTLPWQPQPAATSLSSNTTSPLSSPSTSPSSSSSSSLSSSSSPSPSSSSLPKPSYSSSPSPSPSPLSLQQTVVTLSPWQPEPGHKIVNLTWDVKEMINSSNLLCADNASNHRVIEVPEETALRIKVNEGDVSVAFWEVTEENFQQCSVSNGKSIIPLHTADGFVLLEEMLSLGNNYFLAIVNDLAAKAMPALRVNVTVKASICIEEKNGLQCSGRGQCITKPSVAAFYCDCEEGHIGLFCEEFDGCSSLQCQNNATCLDVKQGNTERNFTCVCSPGYTGEVCESQIDHCTSQPCEHGATCLSRATGYSCVCPEGFTGLACEQRIDPCALLPCQNNGTCFTDGTSYSCNCSPAYTGPLCTQLIDFCALSPCAHGICRGVGTSYKCLCAPGYHGLYCEEEDDECLSEPCQNSGTCKDLVNGYECLCPDEYEGQHCDLYKDPCTAVSCQNGGTCTSKEQNATCVCVPGFTGERCEADINECDSDPCHHGGTCMNEANGYTCHCPQGWVGIHCDVYLEWKSDRMAESLNNMPRHSLYIIIGALCVAFVLMLIILIVGICRISRIEYQGSSRPSYEEFYNCRSIDSEFSTAIASIRHARFGKKSRPAMYDATPVTYEDYSPDDKPLVTLIKTKDL